MTVPPAQPVAHVGLIVDGHGHDPDEVLAAARAWLVAEHGLTPVGVRQIIPINALPAETWWGDESLRRSRARTPGDPRVRGGAPVQDGLGGRPVTIVQLPKRLVAGAPAEPTFEEA